MGFYHAPGSGLLDLALALAGAVVLVVPAAVVGILIRIVDGPPVLYSQQRVGRHGRLFRLHKFRTMVASNRERQHGHGGGRPPRDTAR